MSLGSAQDCSGSSLKVSVAELAAAAVGVAGATRASLGGCARRGGHRGPIGCGGWSGRGRLPQFRTPRHEQAAAASAKTSEAAVVGRQRNVSRSTGGRCILFLCGSISWDPDSPMVIPSPSLSKSPGPEQEISALSTPRRRARHGPPDLTPFHRKTKLHTGRKVGRAFISGYVHVDSPLRQVLGILSP